MGCARESCCKLAQTDRFEPRAEHVPVIASVNHEPPLAAEILERVVKASSNSGAEAAFHLNRPASPVWVVDDQVDLRPAEVR